VALDVVLIIKGKCYLTAIVNSLLLD